jgi:hypothetical protein
MCASPPCVPRARHTPSSGQAANIHATFVLRTRILDSQEAVVLVNPNGTASRGGDFVIAAELSHLARTTS